MILPSQEHYISLDRPIFNKMEYLSPTSLKVSFTLQIRLFPLRGENTTVEILKVKELEA